MGRLAGHAGDTIAPARHSTNSGASRPISEMSRRGSRGARDSLTKGWNPPTPKRHLGELSDDTGEFLTTAEFSSDEVVYYLWFTPRNPSPLPDALLSHLLSASTQTELDSQRTRLAFPGHVKNARGNCEIEQGLLVSFSGSVEEVSETVSCQPE